MQVATASPPRLMLCQREKRLAVRPLARIHAFRAIRDQRKWSGHTSLRDAQPSRKRFGRSSGASAR
jgi:hypothetical protein